MLVESFMFTDVVSGEPVLLCTDAFGRRWLANGPWSLFRCPYTEPPPMPECKPCREEEPPEEEPMPEPMPEPEPEAPKEYLMSQAEAIFRATLEALAEQGNEQAKNTLELVARLPITGKDLATARAEINAQLAGANEDLIQAIRSNSGEWTGATDTHIGRAQTHILHAVSLLSLV
jgi:hypothetical protein